MKVQKRKLVLICTVLLSLLLVLPMISGCAPKAAPPPKEKAVTYLSLSDYTGPIAGLMVPAQAGCEDYIKGLNSKGGVEGIKINFVGVDTRYHTGRGISAYKRYRTEPNLLVMNSCSTAITKAIAPLTEADKVLQCTPADGEFQARIGWVLTWGGHVPERLRSGHRLDSEGLEGEREGWHAHSGLHGCRHSLWP